MYAIKRLNSFSFHDKTILLNENNLLSPSSTLRKVHGQLTLCSNTLSNATSPILFYLVLPSVQVQTMLVFQYLV